ncbi:MAG: hypothetical protein MN733_38700 [Nitrososphaera sp.]|nr:hypothetical protein [Nitrososphaera sp.]
MTTGDRAAPLALGSAQLLSYGYCSKQSLEIATAIARRLLARIPPDFLDWASVVVRGQRLALATGYVPNGQRETF